MEAIRWSRGLYADFVFARNGPGHAGNGPRHVSARTGKRASSCSAGMVLFRVANLEQIYNMFQRFTVFGHSPQSKGFKVLSWVGKCGVRRFGNDKRGCMTMVRWQRKKGLDLFDQAHEVILA